MKDRTLLLTSVALQIILAFYLGHQYDMRISLAAGYLTATGSNPYESMDLRQVFSNPALFGQVPGIGYPSLAPLLFGLMYLLVILPTRNILVYNLALKLPIILANILLAGLLRRVLDSMGVDDGRARRAWLFILFNPFILYTTSAWGQLDGIIALLSLYSLFYLFHDRVRLASVLMAASFSLKPVALPLIPLAIVYTGKSSSRKAADFIVFFLLSASIMILLPYLVLGWSPQPIINGWDAHFSTAGGMSPLTFLEMFDKSYSLPESLRALGFIWIPVTALGCLSLFLMDFGSLANLVDGAVVVLLVFFLSRMWLSEPNLNVVLPLILILYVSGRVSPVILHLFWVLPLVFTIVNMSLPQLLFLVYPKAIEIKEMLDASFFEARIFTRFLLVIPWQVLGWLIVAGSLKRLVSAEAPRKEIGYTTSAPLVRSSPPPTTGIPGNSNPGADEEGGYPRDSPRLSVIIPVKSPEPYLDTLMERIEALPLSKEVLVQTERGLSNAVRIGVEKARGDVIAILDGDGSHDPRHILEMVEMMGEGHELVLGSRYVEGGGKANLSPVRGFISQVFTTVTRKLLGIELRDPLTGMVVGEKPLFRKLVYADKSYKFSLELLPNAENPAEHPIQFKPRQDGKSKVSLVQGLRSMVLLGIIYVAKMRDKAQAD